jgi:hypothetical protein
VSWVDQYEPDDDELEDATQELFAELKGVKVNTVTRYRRKKLDHERKGKEGRSPVKDYIRSLGDYKSTKEVAEELGKSEGWVRKAAAKRWTQAPSYVAPFGDTHVNLYTEEDIQALKDYIETHHAVYRREDYPFDEEGTDGETATS